MSDDNTHQCNNFCLRFCETCGGYVCLDDMDQAELTVDDGSSITYYCSKPCRDRGELKAMIDSVANA